MDISFLANFADKTVEFVEGNLPLCCAVSILGFLLLNTFVPKLLLFCSKILFDSMPVEKAFIPAALPHPNNYEKSEKDCGRTPPFQVKLTEANSKQIADFCKFRGLPVDASLDAVARSAVQYKAEMFDRKYMYFLVEHFGKGRKLEFPWTAPHWNGWSGYNAELGPFLQNYMHGFAWILIQHIICGFMLPILYIMTEHPFFFLSSLVLDIGFNVADLGLLWFAALTGRERGGTSRTVPEHFSINYAHHIGAASMEVVALFGGRDVAWIGCFTVLCMLGITGVNILVFVVWPLTPGQDLPLLSLIVSLINVACMVVFRGFVWVYICYEICMITYTSIGNWAFMVIVPGLLIFTGFNVVLTQLMAKNAKNNYKTFMASKKKD